MYCHYREWDILCLFKLFISKYTDLDSVTGHFSFLGTESAFLGWNDESFGKLWSYNLNYMDYLHQETISFEQAVCWIDKFVDEIEGNRNGLEPYPIALRGSNGQVPVEISSLYSG